MVLGKTFANGFTKIRKNKALASGIVLVLLAVLSFGSHRVFFRSTPHNSPQSSASPASWHLDWHWSGDASIATSAVAVRPVFPFSVVPGGVANAKELQAAVEHDPVVAAHYEGFRIGSARVVRVPKDRQVYVSYRIGNRVYWTHKKVTLHAGETLLSDGSHLVRTRCGNRVADNPAGPAAPQEPSDAQLSQPVAPARPDVETVDIPAGPLVESGPSPVLLASGPEPTPDGPVPGVGVGGGFPPTGSGFPCCGGPSGSVPKSPTPYTGPPVLAPEPSSALLLFLGLVAAFVLWKFRRP